MISRLLDAARARVQMADAVAKTDETLTLRLRDGEVIAAHTSEQAGHNLRVVVDGRIGVAGTTALDPDALLDAALASAAAGDEAPLLLPSPSPLPRVHTHVPRAAAATVTELGQLGRLLTNRLCQGGRSVTVHVERSVGSVHVGNTRGVDTAYPVTLVALDINVRSPSEDGSVHVVAHVAGADLPGQAVIDTLVTDFEQRLAWAAAPAPAPATTAPVLLLPEAVRALLVPVQQALVGKAFLLGTSPLAENLGEQVLHPSLFLTDDPLLDGQAGSRPVDDEGVASFRAPLIEGGVVCRCIYDLETGALAGRPSTGHGRRSTFGKAQPAFSNLVLHAGEHDLASLIAAMGDGLLVDAVAGGTGGSSRSGTFTHPVVLGYRVQGGEVIGRVEGVVIAGNIFDALGSIGGIGRDARWIGSSLLPPLLLEGVTVAPR
jgi:PmbA protein